MCFSRCACNKIAYNKRWSSHVMLVYVIYVIGSSIELHICDLLCPKFTYMSTFIKHLVNVIQPYSLILLKVQLINMFWAKTQSHCGFVYIVSFLNSKACYITMSILRSRSLHIIRSSLYLGPSWGWTTTLRISTHRIALGSFVGNWPSLLLICIR